MISKTLMAASTRPIILAILSRGEDYGYSIIQKVKDIYNSPEKAGPAATIPSPRGAVRNWHQNLKKKSENGLGR